VPFGTSRTQIAKLPPGSKVDASDRYAEKTVYWPKLLLVAFLIWWLYAFLNDSEGRLWRWTDHAYGKVPVEVQKVLDATSADKKTPATASTPATAPVTPGVATATNAAPAK
jgi:hypothetical protein